MFSIYTPMTKLVAVGHLRFCRIFGGALSLQSLRKFDLATMILVLSMTEWGSTVLLCVRWFLLKICLLLKSLISLALNGKLDVCTSESFDFFGFKTTWATLTFRFHKLCSYQVSWIWEPIDGQRDNIAVYHPTYGQSFPNSAFKDRVAFLHNSLENPSIRISNLRMSDAGRYTCEYATYPSGNEQGTTTLIMLGE